MRDSHVSQLLPLVDGLEHGARFVLSFWGSKFRSPSPTPRRAMPSVPNRRSSSGRTGAYPAHVHPLAMPPTQAYSAWCHWLSLTTASLGPHGPTKPTRPKSRSTAATSIRGPQTMGACKCCALIPHDRGSSAPPWAWSSPRRPGDGVEPSRPFEADRVVPFHQPHRKSSALNPRGTAVRVAQHRGSTVVTRPRQAEWNGDR